jgi:diguanylate cyclase (GGDEF)-like protein
MSYFIHEFFKDNMPRLKHKLNLRVVIMTITLTIMTGVVGMSAIASLNELKDDYQRVKDEHFDSLLEITQLKIQTNKILAATSNMFLAENEKDLEWGDAYVADKANWIVKISEKYSNNLYSYQELLSLTTTLSDQSDVISAAMMKKIALSEQVLSDYKSIEQYRRDILKQGKTKIALAIDDVLLLFNPLLKAYSETEPSAIEAIISPLKSVMSTQDYEGLSTLLVGPSSISVDYQAYSAQLAVLETLKEKHKELTQSIITVMGDSVLSAQKAFLTNLTKVEEKISVRESFLYLLLLTCVVVAIILIVFQTNLLRRIGLIRQVIDAGDSKAQYRIAVKGDDDISEIAKVIKGYIQTILDKDNIISDNNKKLQHLVTHDDLTNIYNRRYFEIHMAQEHIRYLRYKEPYCLAMLNIDSFKGINERFGHNLGDKVILDFTLRIDNQMRQTDVFARLSGEDFILLMPRTDQSNALILMERIRSEINAMPTVVNDRKIDFTVSIGLMQVQEVEEIEDASQQMQFVKQALEEAKMTGRNKVCRYRSDVIS